MLLDRLGYFVTGTDTEVGKTLIAAAILTLAKQAGLRTAALKPVAAGGIMDSGTMVNEDALLLRQTSTSKQSYEEVNPVLLNEPIAPHIAAKLQGVDLDLQTLIDTTCGVLENQSYDLVIVEGAGGWLVPLDYDTTLADYARAIGFPVILVVGMKLGCLSHAMLTVKSIADHGLNLAGWIGNCLDPGMLALSDNLVTLKSMIPSPCLGVVDFMSNPTVEAVSRCIDFSSLDK